MAKARATIVAQAGESDSVLDEIERLLGGTPLLSIHTLRLEPFWDPLMSNSRFQALLAKAERS